MHTPYILTLDPPLKYYCLGHKRFFGLVLINRAAMKMANMDTAFDFMFTSPKDDKGVSFIVNLVFDTSVGAEVDERGEGSAVTVYSGSKP